MDSKERRVALSWISVFRESDSEIYKANTQLKETTYVLKLMHSLAE